MWNVPFYEAVSSAMYTTVTMRPDIVHAMSHLAQYIQNPRKVHWEAIKHIIWYLKGTHKYWLVFRAINSSLEGFTDSDWGL